MGSEPVPPADEADKDDSLDPEGRGRPGLAGEMAILALIAFVVAMLLKSFVVQAFVIPSGSMIPTLELGDRVLVNRLAYRFDPPSRGDVVVFLNPRPAPEEPRGAIGGFVHRLVESIGFGLPQDTHLIKRVIGLPGETVTVRGDGVEVDGQRLREPYVNLHSGPGPLGTWRVPQDSVFMMGDNRGGSEDSRAFGPVPIDSIVGRAAVRIWPPSRWGGI